MADDDSPRPFRRERNLSNRNFARNSHNSRRRFSTESHSSIESSSFDSSATSAVNAAGPNDSSSASTSSLQFLYSVHSDTDSGFQQKTIRKMLPANGDDAAEDEGAVGGADAHNETADSFLGDPVDPALLDVKQKVKRFETLKAHDRIIFKTGKINWSTHPETPPTVPPRNRRSLGRLRVLPVMPNMMPCHDPDDVADSAATTLRSPVLPVHQHSIDEVATDDEFDDSEFSNTDDDGEDQPGDNAVTELALEINENMPLTPLPSPGGVPDEFGSAIELSSEIYGQHHSTAYIKSSSLVEASAGQESEVKPGIKDFPRNYRSTPRPKTEIVGIKNHNVKYHSLHNPRDDDDDECEDEIVLREKSDACVHPILEELIHTEETYVANMLRGIRNYGNIFNRPDIPAGLRGKKYVLLGNIEHIAEFHRDEFLPMLKRNRRDLKRLFDEFIQFIDQNCFYGYVIFTMNKKRSLELCDVYKNYFKLLQTELDDKLGINSFLVQPIQRMARYPLLLNEFITTLFKNHEVVMKQLIESCCRLEKKVRTLLKVTNESEIINDIVDCNEFNVFYQGKFRKVSEFMVFDHTLKRTYRSKVFIFDKCIIYTEIKGKNLIFHGRYPCEHIGILAKTKSFTLYYEQRKKQECDFSGDPQMIEMWLDLIREMINSYVTEERKNLQERYSRENDHLHRKPPSLSLFRDSNRFSSDSGIGNIWVLPKPELEEATNNRTTWYAMS